MRGDRIYPVPVKPPSRFNRWSDWPQDLVPAIRALIRGWYRVGVFKCSDCGAFCESHPYGAAHVRVPGRRDIPPSRGGQPGDPVCDDCLIERARALPGEDAQ